MRRAKDVEIALAPRLAGVSLQRWLYAELRQVILDGRLTPGARLPASRDLAERYQLSRGTVVSVFAQLSAEGYLMGAVGRGSFVASTLPEQWLRASSTAHWVSSERQRSPPIIPQLSLRGQLLARSPFPMAVRAFPARAFRASQPDLAAFPIDLWVRTATRKARLSPRSLLTDGDVCGYLPLRQAIAEHLCAARGIRCSAEQVVVLGSVQQVIDVSARLLLDPGDAVWMEDPGYPGARQVLEAAGARIVGVPVDTSGMDVAAGRTLAPAARLAYVTAGRQAPLGHPLALERRMALLAWAQQAQAMVIEDDYDSEYNFTSGPLAALKSLDQAGRVIYCGTFSKLLFPALRLAYAVLPDSLMAPFTAALSLTCRHVALEPQLSLSAFIVEGHLGRHIRRMRQLYAERAEALQQAAITHWAGLLHVPAIHTGLDAPAFLPAGVDDKRVSRLAAAAGIETRPMSFYQVSQLPAPGLVLGFAAVGAGEIEASARILAQVIESL